VVGGAATEPVGVLVEVGFEEDAGALVGVGGAVEDGDSDLHGIPPSDPLGGIGWRPKRKSSMRIAPLDRRSRREWRPGKRLPVAGAQYLLQLMALERTRGWSEAQRFDVDGLKV
jgi:hypothetical protein